MARRKVKIPLTEKELEKKELEKWTYGLKVTYFGDLVKIPKQEFNDFRVVEKWTKKEITQVIRELKQEVNV